MKKKRKVVNNVCNAIAIVSIIIMIIFVCYIYNLNMLPNKFLGVFLFAIFTIYLILIILIIPKKIKIKIKIFCTFVLAVFAIVFFYGIKYVDKTISFIEKINNELAQKEEYYLLTLSSNLSKKITDINNGKIGFYLNNATHNTKKAISLLKKKINFEEKDYNDVIKMFDDLCEKKIEGVLINSSIKNLTENELSYLNLSLKTIGEILVPVETSDIVKIVDVTTTPFNIYIAGGDAYGTINKITNTDVNMIVSVNPISHEILLTSIPRDYYVKLYGIGDNAMDKLTHAGYYGIETSVKTIENLLDIEINYYAKINFSTVESIIDSINGIDIYSDYSFCANGLPEICYSVGKQHLNGFNALMFSREREAFSNGDIQRTKNQQKVISAIIEKITSSTALIINYSSILDAVSENLSTNLDSNSIAKLVKQQINKMSNWKIINQNLVGHDLFTYETYTFPNVRLYVMKPNDESIKKVKTKIKNFIGG
ncbi:MAG: LCP family protein [Bacilli bacterium]